MFLRIAGLFLLLMFTCSFGYIGDLPKLGKTTKPQITNSESNILPVSNKKITKPSKPKPIKPYLKEVNELVPILQDIQKILEGQEKNYLQLFCAKSNLISLAIDSLQNDYNKKPESSSKSYIQFSNLNSSLAGATKYCQKFIEDSKYIKVADVKVNTKLLEEKFDKVKREINTTLKAIDEDKEKI